MNYDPFDPNTSKEQMFKLRRRMAYEIENNPVYRQYQQHISHQHQELNDKPWHAIGEKLYATWLLLHASMPVNKIEVIGVQGEFREPATIALAATTYISTPYLWSDDMEKLADAAPLPKHIISPSIMPMTAMFWSRETAYLSKEGDNNWLAVFQWQDRMVVVGDLTDEKTVRLRIITTNIQFGKTWPDDFKQDDDIGRVLKRCAFLNSPYVAGDVHKLPRHQRRQMERADLPKEKIQEQIHVVKLRRRVDKAAAQAHAEAAGWKHQWWVSGHYRAQWYPSEKAHKVIWIAPYLKGPDGLPILEKMYAVVR